MHVIAAKAVAFKEALEPSFKEYQKQVIANAQALANSLIERGLRIVSGKTESHVMLVDLRAKKITGKEAEAGGGEAADALQGVAGDAAAVAQAVDELAVVDGQLAEGRAAEGLLAEGEPDAVVEALDGQAATVDGKTLPDGEGVVPCVRGCVDHEEGLVERADAARRGVEHHGGACVEAQQRGIVEHGREGQRRDRGADHGSVARRDVGDVGRHREARRADHVLHHDLRKKNAATVTSPSMNRFIEVT